MFLMGKMISIPGVAAGWEQRLLRLEAMGCFHLALELGVILLKVLNPRPRVVVCLWSSIAVDMKYLSREIKFLLLLHHLKLLVFLQKCLERVVADFNFPNGVEDYVNRIGRTVRAGASGVAYTSFRSHQSTGKGQPESSTGNL